MDVDEFTHLTRPLRAGQLVMESPSPNMLRRAVALYRDDLLIDLYDDWVLVERERYRGLYLTALNTLTTTAEAAGDPEEAVNYAERLAIAAPIREDAQRRLMRLYAQSGRGTWRSNVTAPCDVC